MQMNAFKRQDGFTLPEVIMVVAVMAVVSAMAFPDIVSFFKRQSFEQEKIVQKEIIKAMDAYSKAQTGHFADDPNMITLPLGDQVVGGGAHTENNPETCVADGGWGKLLSAYSNLSAAEICNDVWGMPREYIVAQDELNYRDGRFFTYYATILSNGENKQRDTETTWGTSGNVANSYGAYNAGGDDLLAKFSDVKLKTELFEETLRRMDRVVEALDRYAQARYNEALIGNEEYSGLKLFYPPEFDDWGYGTGRPAVFGTGEWYGQIVNQDVVGAYSGTSLRSADADSGIRRESMEALMRIIGLPQEFCCDALTGAPFYYYSNPIVSAAAGSCATPRRVEPPYMPPKLTIEALPCN